MAKEHQAQIVDITADQTAIQAYFHTEFFMKGNRKDIVEQQVYAFPIAGFNEETLIQQISENCARLNALDIEFEDIKRRLYGDRFNEDGRIGNNRPNKAEK